MHIIVLAIFWIWGVLKNKTTTKIGKIVNFANFQKMHPYLQKGLVGMGVKRGVTICDTQKLCFVENTLVKCFQQSTAIAEKRV